MSFHDYTNMMFSPDDFAHLKIPLENILSATNNFSDKKIIHITEVEKRYSGQLMLSGELIRIRARRWLNKERDDEKEQQFWMEISMLSTLKHKNLVSLVGFCDENDEKIIITKRETRYSLENHLSDTMMLTWVRRLEICVGLANALSYIHYDEPRDFSIIHRNIDSEIVLLNENWEAKLSGFELSMKIKASERHLSFDTSKVSNRLGYTDPTYLKTKSAHHKSDMYSFGIVMFELVCGRKSVIAKDYNKYLAPLAITHYREKKLHEIIDWGLWNQMDSQSFNMFAEIAYDCLKEERSQRPDIDEIVPRLVQALELARENMPIMPSPKDDLAHLKIPLESILTATNNFDRLNNHIRTKAIAEVYKGQLLWSGDLININAVRLDKGRDEEKDQQFWMEVSMLSSLKHKNVVSLVGFCDENDEKIIITKYDETRGMLDNYLRDPMRLTWVRRLEICVGLANGLSYIHHDESRDFSVIHRSISSKTVLLNDDWEPKLSDFECSMKIEAGQRHHSFLAYKLEYVSGYVDPTYLETKSVNHKSDMYSFGIILFELLCGRKSEDDNDLAPLAITHYREKTLHEIIDQGLWKQIDSQSLNMFAEIAYDCLKEERSQRPDIDDIVPRLVKALELARENRPIHSVPKHLAHLRIPLDDIESATNYFDKENVIREGGFEQRYKGELLWSGELIDITAQSLTNKEWDDENEHRFWTEIEMLFELKHKNLVSIVGYCNEVGAKIIVYRHDSKGRLDNYLSDPTLLTWVKRLEICIDIVHALSYIHYDEPRDFSIIHRNISSSAILLNDDWEPKLSQFEHSMKIKASERHDFFHTDSVWSTEGYTDPTYLETNTVNHKSDIYSFGIVLFELLCGRKSVSDDQDNKYLAPVAIFHYREKTLDDIIDPYLLKQMDPESFNVFAETAYDCLNEERSQRLNVDEIVTRLEKALEHELKRENVENSIAEAEVGGTSINHEKGPVQTFISIGNESQVSKNTKSFLQDPSLLKLSFQDLKSATNNFEKESIINKHERIFKGRLLRSEQFINIFGKAYSSEKDESKKFWVELSMFSSLKHKNLVSLIGFYDGEDGKAIIYKREANESLKKHLSGQTLTWMQRLKICIGVGNALSYIHYDAGRDFSVIHCNIKSTEILLDENWEPKLSGFGHSLKSTVARRHRLFLTRDIVKDAYLDPKYKKTGGMTHKSDVYSFGVVLFEVLCGRSAILPDEELEGGLLSQLAKSRLDDMIDQWRI